MPCGPARTSRTPARGSASPESSCAAGQTSFREIGGQHERTLEDWRAYLLDTERFDAAPYLVAEAGGQLVGAALSQPTGALRLYEEAGMTVPEQFTRWDWPAG